LVAREHEATGRLELVPAEVARMAAAPRARAGRPEARRRRSSGACSVLVRLRSFADEAPRPLPGRFCVRVRSVVADIFVKLGDIKGESLDDKHKDEIEVMSYSWGVSNAGSMNYGTGGGEGKAS